MDLSSPHGKSVNDGISSELASLSSITIDEIARLVASLLAKMDIHNTYRMVPVHPEDRALLGMRWKGMVYVDTKLGPPSGCGQHPRSLQQLLMH